MRVRLAPSPTGTLHIGTARTAVFNWLFARKHNGTFLIRIEDTDLERSKAEFTDNILEGLKWLGLQWEGDPVVQSHRIEAHRAAIIQLLESGKAYRCYTTEAELSAMRERQQELGQAPRYDNRHRDLSVTQERALISEGREAVIRFRINENAQIHWHDMVRGSMSWSGGDLGGDMVIARRAPADQIGNPLYNLVVVVDDAAMAISHVIRGEDHIANTAKQMLLYEALALPIPTFAHTPLILNRDGRKLSKRDGVTSISEFRTMGYDSGALTNYMTLLGWSPPEGMGERFTLSEAAKVFDFRRVNRAGARFDWEKLNWLNSQVLHKMNPRALRDQLLPLWQAKNWVPKRSEQDHSSWANPSWQTALCQLIGPSLTLLQDGVDQAAPFFSTPDLSDAAKTQLSSTGAREALVALHERLPEGQLDPGQAKDLLAEAAVEAGVKKGVMMKCLRAALLGSLQGPDLLETWMLLHHVGTDRDRIAACLKETQIP